jgi:Flp pilus assembly protein TadB
MAQTRRRRRSKHRGNAAGVVEARGRTGRPPTAAERSGRARQTKTAREKRLERYDRPPSWRSAFNRAMIAAVLMLVVSLLLLKKPGAAIALFPVVLLLYVPLGYYFDLYLYRRRQRQKAARPK